MRHCGHPVGVLGHRLLEQLTEGAGGRRRHDRPGRRRRLDVHRTLLVDADRVVDRPAAPAGEHPQRGTAAWLGTAIGAILTVPVALAVPGTVWAGWILTALVFVRFGLRSMCGSSPSGCCGQRQACCSQCSPAGPSGHAPPPPLPDASSPSLPDPVKASQRARRHGDEQRVGDLDRWPHAAVGVARKTFVDVGGVMQAAPSPWFRSLHPRRDPCQVRGVRSWCAHLSPHCKRTYSAIHARQVGVPGERPVAHRQARATGA